MAKHIEKLLRKVSKGKLSVAKAADLAGLSKKQIRKQLKQVEPKPKRVRKASAPAVCRQLDQLTIDDPIIANHLICGEWLIPAAMMLTHVITRSKSEARQLKQTVFHRPPVVSGDYAIETLIDGDQFEFRADGTTMAVGQLGGGSVDQVPSKLAIPTKLSPIDPFFYDRIKPLGYGYGPALRIIDQFCDDGTQLCYRLEPRYLPKPKLPINPFLLDGVFQCLLHAGNVEHVMRSEQTAFLPYKFDVLKLFEPLNEPCYVVIKHRDIQRSERDLSADIMVYGAKGQPLLSLQQMTLTKLTVDLSSPSEKKVSHAGAHAYLPTWQPLTPTPAEADLLHVLVGAPETLSPIAKHFDEHNAATIRITPAASFARKDDHHFQLPFEDASAWQLLAQALPAERPIVIHFLHAFQNAEEPARAAAGETALLQVMALCQALIRSSRQHIRLRVPTFEALLVNDDERVHGYAFAGLAGLLKTLRLETVIDAAMIDVDAPDAQALAPLLLGAAGKSDLAVLAVRQRIFHGESFANVPQAEQNQDAPSFVEGGSFIIIGGAGGIGQNLCKHFAARTPNLHFVWIGRSAINRSKQEAIAAVQLLGAKVDYHACDATDSKALGKLIKRIAAKHQIRGVIHAGGLNEETLLQSKAADSFERVYRAKAHAIEALFDATSNLKLDFFSAFASTIGITGSVSQCDYAAANAFLDSFCQHHRHSKHKLVQALDWTLWFDGGMGLDNSVRDKFVKRTGVIWAADVFPLLDRLLSSPHPQVVIAGNRSYFQSDEASDQSQEPATTTQAKPAEAKIDMAAAIAQPVADVINQLLAEVLDVDPAELDTDVDLRELGVDSVTISDLTVKVEETLAVRFDSTLLYEYQTILEVAHHLAESEGEQLIASLNLDLDALKASATQSNEALPRTAAVQTSSYANLPMTDIAIIGLSGRYPGSDDLESFWQALMARQDMITEVPADRWAWQQYFGDPKQSEDSRTYSKWGGFLKDIKRFDAEFFRISPREAELMDPQQRLLLESAWHVIEDAGYRPSALADSGTGVFIGISNDDYSNLLNQDHVKKQVYTATGSYLSIASNRLSFYFGLHGPSLSIDNACASSLVAIHQAILSLRAGECPVAIAGGVNLCITPRRFMAFSHAGMLSEDGRCKTFDQSANGYVRGEGVGLILLKPAAQAIADGDYIYGIVKGSGVNHGGLNTTITAPSAQAQASLITAAMQQAQFDPTSVSYMEAHGTGTPLGDPLEVRGLKKAFHDLYQTWEKPAPTQPHVAIGALKTNIGHLEAASGIAGLTKVLLAMKYKTLPGNLHLKALNPAIDISNSPLYFLDRERQWEPTSDGQAVPRRAGVSSFGFGGANAHVAVEAYDNARNPLLRSNVPLLFPLSARHDQDLAANAAALAERLIAARDGAFSPAPNLEEIAFTMQTGREEMDTRLVIISQDLDDLIACLKAVAQGEPERTNMRRGQLTRKQSKAAAKAQRGQVFEARPQQLADLLPLAENWVAGHAIDWLALYRENTPRRTPLPGYSFQGEAHWLPEKPPERRSFTTQTTHPLVQERRSQEADPCFVAHLSGDEFFLDEHRVSGKKVLPGTAYLEMAYAAAVKAEVGVGSLNNIHWSNPLVGDQPRQPITRLTPESDTTTFNISSDAQTHATGTVTSQAAPKPPALDAASVQARCPQQRDPQTFYADLAALGLQLQHGTFQVIEALHVGQREVFARLRLAGDQQGNNPFTLHPALLDGALQTVYALYFARGDHRLHVPFSMDRISVYAAIPETCLVHARQLEVAHGDTLKFDLIITDTQGACVVSIQGFMPRPFRLPGSAPKQPRPLEIEAGDQALLLQLQAQPLPATPSQTDTEEGLVVLFDVEPERWQMLWGSRETHAVWVRPGPAFAAPEPDIFEIAPGDRDDYATLIHHLMGLGKPLRRVIFNWGAAHENPYLESEPQAEALFQPLFHLLQSLAKEGGREPITVVVPFVDDASTRACAHRGLSGFGRSLIKERPNLKLIPLALTTSDPESWISKAQQASKLATKAGDLLLATTAGFQREALAAVAEPTAIGSPLRHGGVYFVTGGSGALARHTSMYLAKTYNAKLVLCGRRPSDATIEATLAALQTNGGQARYVQADISNQAALQHALQTAKQAFGKLNGVFHIAGMHHDNSLPQKTAEEALAVLRPKTQGTLNLAQALQDQTLDVFVIYSSLVAAVGNAGQTDYAFANGFASAFATARAQISSTRTLAIDWPHWRDGGMQLAEQTEIWFAETTGLRPVETDEAMTLLEQALASPASHVAVMVGEGQRIAQTLLADADTPAQQETDSAPVVATEQAQLVQQLTDEIAAMLRANLKVRKIDPRRDLAEYGADSVNLSEFANLLNRKYGLKISPAIFFEYPSLETLVGYLVDKYGQQLQASAAQSVSEPQPPKQVANSSGPAQSQNTQKVATSSDSAQSNTTQNDAETAVAVVGMAGIMPGSQDLNAFWQNLLNGVDLVGEVPADRWDWQAYHGDPTTQANRTHSKWGGFMPNPDHFDHSFFGITRREASMMDPQQRLLMALSWHAIEDAGQAASELAGSATGCFMGVSSFDYFDLMKNHQLDIEAFTSTGVVHSILANRISWLLDLRGPSFPIDTACSSSLVALHQAVEAIASGSCTQALVGGVNLLASPTITISFSKAGMLSPDGRCRTFDTGANGYVRGEGAGVIYVKRLSDALADGNPIYGVIRGSATNHGGRAKSLTAPNPHAQAQLVRRAHDQAGFDPETVTYIEAHGTGTALGDPVELNGLKNAFQQGLKQRNKQAPQQAWCGVGSIKTNIGHLEAGAGMAGLFKILLAMRHGVLPANLHFKEQNPFIDIADSPFFLVSQNREWTRLKDANGREIPRRAGISSFGFGGANAHIAIEEFIDDRGYAATTSEPRPLVISAKSSERLQVLAKALADHLRSGTVPEAAWADCCYTLQVGREAMPHRMAAPVRSLTECISALDRFCNAASDQPSLYVGTVDADTDPREVARGADTETICQAWVEGAVIDWQALPQNDARRRLTLPLYPFAPTRCWLQIPEGATPEGGVPVPRQSKVTGSEPVLRQTNATVTGPEHLMAYHQGFDALDALARSWLVQILLQLGVFDRNQRRYEWSSARPANLAKQMNAFFDALPHLLVQGNWATYDGTNLKLVVSDFPEAFEAFDGPAQATALAEQFSGVAPHLRLLRTCLQQLPAVLTGQCSGTSVLFPDGDHGLVAPIYAANPHADYINQLAAQHVSALASAKPLRILEVGAGTGGTTKAVLAALKGQAQHDYVFSDVSRFFLENAQRELDKSAGPQLHFALLDLEQAALDQGFQAQSFDVIIAANVLHATRDVSATLQRLTPLLKSGGHLVLSELTQPNAFLTLTFGLLDGWWAFDQSTQRLPGSPLLDQASWQKVLQESGFEAIAFLGDEARGNVLSQHLIEAQLGAAKAVHQPVPMPEPRVVTAVKPQRQPQPQVVQKTAAPTTDLQGYTEQVLQAQIQIALREEDPPPMHKTFSDLGIDSIFGVELIGRLNQAFGLKLKPNVLFDHATPLRLAAFLVQQYKQAIEQAAAQELGNAPKPVAVEPVQAITQQAQFSPPRFDQPSAPQHTPQPAAHTQPWQASAQGVGFGIRVEGPQAPEDSQPQALAISSPPVGAVLIRVRAFSVNYGDLLCIRGLYPTMPEYPFTPGMEVAGEIVAIGKDVQGWSVGDAVIALTGHYFGAHASMAIADADMLVAKPADVTFEAAAAFPVAYLIADRALSQANLQSGETVLIQAASGGVGTVAVQLAAARGARVIVTSSSTQKLNALKELGADHLIDYSRSNFSDAVRQITKGLGVDVVINSVAGDAMQQGLDLLAPGGRYVEIAMMALRTATQLDLSRLVDNQSFHSIDLRRYMAMYPERARRAMQEMAQTLATGQIKPVIARTFAFEETAQAYAFMEQRKHVGRIVVQVAQADLAPVTATREVGDIAMIGVSGRYPGAENLEQFWQNLVNGVDSVSEAPAQRWHAANYYDPSPRTPGKTYCTKGGFLADIDRFDAGFFNMSGTEAAHTDPQQRLFLEQAYLALEQAGYATQEVGAKRCGVYVGVGVGDYHYRFLRPESPPSTHVFSGNQASILAARIAYHLNLKGPALAIDTACSSSLVAIHQACDSLRSGAIDMAIAGGVFVSCTANFHVLCSQMGMLSPSGRCATFDHNADGFVPGEGVGAVILKPLAKAIEDGDHLLGVIRASGLNQDGATNGITAPSGASQRDLALEVYQRGGIDPHHIGYVETHGTGTALGDPIEVEALTEVFHEYGEHDQQGTALGSVKTNIGHAATAAGIAGLSKILLSLQQQTLPPSLHFQQANPHIQFEQTPFFVNTSATAWPQPASGERLAALSSFGFSGTNCHMVIGEAPQLTQSEDEAWPLDWIAVSARSAAQLVQRVQDLLAYLDVQPDCQLADLAYTLNARRAHYEHRLILLTSGIAQLKRDLGRWLAGETPQDCWSGKVSSTVGQSHKLSWSDDSDWDLAQLHREMKRVAEAYVAGNRLDWSFFYQDRNTRNLPLPGYPFERQRHWVATAEEGLETVGVAAKGPAVTIPVPKPRVAPLPTALDSTAFYLDHHRVKQQAVLPGVMYLELVRQAASQQYPNRTLYGFEEVTWLRPLHVADGTDVPFQIEIATNPTSGVTRFSLHTEAGEHASGNLLFAKPASPKQLMSQDSGEAESGNDFYTRLDQAGYSYGPSMRAVVGLKRNVNSAVAQLQLPAAAPALEQYTLHPSLLDGALQAVVGLENPERPALPFYVEAVELYAPLQAAMVVHVESRGDQQYDVQLCNAKGEVCVQLRGITARSQPDPLAGMFYTPQAYRLAEQPKQHLHESGSVLVVYRQGALALHKAIAEQQGERPVFAIRIGKRLATLGKNEWEVPADDSDALRRVLDEIPKIGSVYFLAALQDQLDPDDPAALAQHETMGVVVLFHLVRALHQSQAEHLCVIRAVMDQTTVITNDTLPRPLSASLAGFCRSAAREFQHLRFVCVDVELTGVGRQARKKLKRLATSIAHQEAHPEGRTISLRDNTSFGFKLVPARVPERAEATPFRKNGTYLILGGSGGIGMVLARHLMTVASANVVLIGRRPAEAGPAEQIAELHDLPGQAIYMQADGGNAEAMAEVVAQVKARFGDIHGAIHSAIVLQDRLVEHMTEATFVAALHPKTYAMAAFCQALRHESLDFLLLFSSLQSFVGAAGQSNYAAGCTFLDAYARYWRSQVNYPVKLLHWGYWGSVGVVRGESYHRRMAEMGLHSIEPETGIPALERFLASDFQTLLAVRADKDLLKQVGVDWSYERAYPERRLPAYREQQQRSALKLPSEAASLARQLRDVEAWCARLIPTLFARLGLPVTPNSEIETQELTQRLGVLPRYQPLLTALLAELEKQGKLLRTKQGYRVAQELEDASPALQKQADDLVAKAPAMKAYVDLVQACCAAFVAVLKGDKVATEVLFPSGSDRLVAGIYRGNHLADFYNQLVAEQVLDLLKAQMPANGNQPLRILEVGAGTGGTTTMILERLGDMPAEYLFSDVSPALVHNAARKLGPQHPQMRFAELNLEQDPWTQGLQLGSFDLIIAGNVLHATSNIDNTLQRLHSLLGKHGHLILNELTANHLFATLTFGLLDGWWAFSDDWRRLPHSPLLDAQTWQAALGQNGFAHVWQLGAAGRNQNRQRVLVAQSDGQIALPATLPLSGAKPEATGYRFKDQADPSPQATVPSVSQPVDSNAQLPQIIAVVMAEILSVDVGQIDLDEPHQRYGVDSLLALDIVDRLNQQLAIDLRATDFFNFATINELASHIASTWPQCLAPSDGGTSSQEQVVHATQVQTAAKQLDETALLELFRQLEAGMLDVDEVNRLIMEQAIEFS